MLIVRQTVLSEEEKSEERAWPTPDSLNKTWTGGE